MTSHFIPYVVDQKRSAIFYAGILDQQPALDVPGMTEFRLSPTSILGLMPESGIRKLLGAEVFSSDSPVNVPRAELYLIVPHSQRAYARALSVGATEVSPPVPRNWGHVVGYVLDPDRHVVAFAEVPE